MYNRNFGRQNMNMYSPSLGKQNMNSPGKQNMNSPGFGNQNMNMNGPGFGNQNMNMNGPGFGNQNMNMNMNMQLRDYGPNPFVIDIENATKSNDTFRTALWTGEHFQLTLMSIEPGEDIGLEVHPELDQFLRVEQGQGVVKMGIAKDKLDFQRPVKDDYIIIIPAGKWHNLTNTGIMPLKLYSIYAPPAHPFGTVHPTKADAEAAEAEDY